MNRLPAAFLAVAFVLAGCSSSSSSVVRQTTAIRNGGTLRINIYAEPSSLNPLLATNTAENFVDSLAFDELVTLNDTFKQTPDLASVVPTVQNGGISKDGLTVTYHLRHGVTWQDGAPFSSADVKFSWQAVMNPKNNVVERTGYDDVASVETPDPYTVVFHLKRPYAPFVGTVFSESDEPFRIIPKHILDKYASINNVPFNQLPIGTGPFKVVRWVHGDHIEYVANPRYFRGRPHLARIDVYTVTDSNTSEAELRSGNVDVVVDIATANLGHLRGARGIRTLLVKAPIYAAIDMNLSRAPLGDIAVRRAVAYAIDEKRIIDNLTYGTATPATADLSDFYWAYDAGLKPIPFDPKKAEQLLSADGWKRGPGGIRQKNGKPLSLQLVYGAGNATAEQIGVLVQSDLRHVGIAVPVKPYLYSLLYATKAGGGILDSGKFDLAEYVWVSGSDPDDSSGWMCDMVPPAGNNITHYCNPQFDAAERIALTHAGRSVRKKAYATTQSLLQRDVPAAFQYYQRARFALRANVRNFRPNGISAGWNAYQWAV